MRDSENLIIEKARNNPVTIEEGRAMVAKLLGNYDDEEITIKQTSIKVSLKSPISFSRIRMPVKGVECNHIDVSNFSYLNKN